MCTVMGICGLCLRYVRVCVSFSVGHGQRTFSLSVIRHATNHVIVEGHVITRCHVMCTKLKTVKFVVVCDGYS